MIVAAMESRKPNLVFVRIPNERARWVLTDRCVVEVECSLCKSIVGEPCKGRGGQYWAGTHYVRRNAWTRTGTKEQKRTMPEDQLEGIQDADDDQSWY